MPSASPSSRKPPFPTNILTHLHQLTHPPNHRTNSPRWHFYPHNRFSKLRSAYPTLSEGQVVVTIASLFQILDAVPTEGKLYEVVWKIVRRKKRVACCEEKVVAKGSLTSFDAER
jgi:hypothetical protein